MRVFKRIVAGIMVILIAFMLCGCQESSEAKLKRLEDEAKQKRKEAQEAQENLKQLEDLYDRYKDAYNKLYGN